MCGNIIGKRDLQSSLEQAQELSPDRRAVQHNKGATLTLDPKTLNPKPCAFQPISGWQQQGVKLKHRKKVEVLSNNS